MKKIICSMLAVILFVSVTISPAFATAQRENEISVYELLRNNGLSDNIIENSELYLCNLRLEVSNSNETNLAHTYDDTESSIIYGILARTDNKDGTWTDNVIFELADNNNNGRLENALSVDAASPNVGLSPADVVYTRTSYGGSISAHNYVFNTTASYYYVDMINYGGGGKAFAPSYSYFKITKANANASTLTNLSFQTILNAQRTVSNTDPTVLVSDDFPYFYRSYTSGTPLLGYQYSFNDYSYYVNQGFSGQLFHIAGVGMYTVKQEFVYAGVSYAVGYDIHSGYAVNQQIW